MNPTTPSPRHTPPATAPVRRGPGIGPRQRIVYEIEDGIVRIRAAGGSLLASAGALADEQPAKSREEERSAYRRARASRYNKKP